MKVFFSMIEWEYPLDVTVPEPVVLDLANRNDLLSLAHEFGNGNIFEMRADGDSEETLKLLRGIVVGIGRCKLAETSTPEIKKAWLYKEGYDCYVQPTPLPAYIFIAPRPDPALFQ